VDVEVTDAAPPAGSPSPTGRAAPRSVKRSLASIVLGFEVIVVFLAALVFFGLKALPAAVALGGGAILCLAMVATIALLRFRWAYAVGWVIQAIVVASGIFNPVMFFVGAMFAAMWTYCMISGTRIDSQKEIA
jgi:hypothetical protein